MTDQYPGSTPEPAPHEADAPPQHGVGPFTPRELVLVIVGALAFLISFFPVLRFGAYPVWSLRTEWVLGVIVPTAATVLVALRRLAPTLRLRVGSLSVDQFASTAFSVGAVSWFGTLLLGYQPGPGALDSGWYTTWVPWLELLLMIAGVFFTVAAPHIPPFRDDFAGRAESPAHPVARAARPVVAAPKQPSGPWAPQHGAPQHGAPPQGAAPSAYGASHGGWDPQNPYAPQPGSAAQAPAPAWDPRHPFAPQAPAGAPYGAPAGYGSAEPAPYVSDETAADAREEIAPETWTEQAAGEPDASVTGDAPAADDAASGDAAWSDVPEEAPAAPGAAAETRAATPAAEEHGGVDEVSVLFAEDVPAASAPEVEAEAAPADEQAQPAGDASPAVPAASPFWALAPVERDVVDEHGAPLFRIGPTAWALVLEDRGDVFVMRDDDGRVGYLHDTTGITRG